MEEILESEIEFPDLSYNDSSAMNEENSSSIMSSVNYDNLLNL